MVRRTFNSELFSIEQISEILRFQYFPPQGWGGGGQRQAQAAVTEAGAGSGFVAQQTPFDGNWVIVKSELKHNGASSSRQEQ